MEIKIVPYSEVYKSYFKSLNLEWLNKYFHPTDADIEILDHPERILAKGGQVFLHCTMKKLQEPARVFLMVKIPMNW